MDAQLTGFISAAQIRQPAGRTGGRVYDIKTDSYSYKRA
jgi:hypothetical protein